MKMYPVFVYGSLMEGYGNHALLIGNYSDKINAIVKGTLYSLGAFPALTLSGDTRVKGELIFIKPERYTKTMSDLDMLEGYTEGRTDNLYTRALVKVMTETGIEYDAWVYTMPPTKLRNDRKIEGGSWREFRPPSDRGDNSFYVVFDDGITEDISAVKYILDNVEPIEVDNPDVGYMEVYYGSINGVDVEVVVSYLDKLITINHREQEELI